MSKENITGVILAGGKNSRMGSDKGMLEVGGEKIVNRIIEVLKPLVNEIIIISNGKNYDKFGYMVFNDLMKDCGPMGGIYTALNYSKTDKILVISCDMPFISKSILTAIVKESNKGEVVIPEHSGGELEPLCAVYSKSCFSKFAGLLKNMKWKLQYSFNYFNVHKILFHECDSPEHHFLNVNTPAEYQKIIKPEYEHTN